VPCWLPVATQPSFLSAGNPPVAGVSQSYPGGEWNRSRAVYQNF